MVKSIRVPLSVSIGSHSYRVILDESEDDGDHSGTCLHHKSEIRLNPLIHKDQLRITYLHECIHLICRVYDINPPETEVTRLAEGIGELLYRNLELDLDFGNIPKVKRVVDVK